jgi:ElaB/YqjD/DUF883 family membrane-anchored ribosome-binding protein
VYLSKEWRCIVATIPNPTRPHAPNQWEQHSNTGGSNTGGTGIGDTLRQAASSVSDAASSVADKVENAWDSASQGMRQSAGYVADKAGDFWTDATDFLGRYPVASVLIAFGLGYLTATLLQPNLPSWNDDVSRRMSRSSM